MPVRESVRHDFLRGEETATHRQRLEEQLSKLQAATEEALSDERDVEVNAGADGQGVGRKSGQAAS